MTRDAAREAVASTATGMDAAALGTSDSGRIFMLSTQIVFYYRRGYRGW
jgi:hypothetical protein